jgi:hypothetical protein
MSMDQPPLRPPLRLLRTRIVGTAAAERVTNLSLAKPNLQLAAKTLPAPKPGHRMSMDQPLLRRLHTRIVGTAMTQERLIQTTQPPSGRATTRRVARTSLAKPNLQLAATTPPAPKPELRMSIEQPPLRRQHTMIVGVAAAKLVKSPPLARASL